MQSADIISEIKNIIKIDEGLISLGNFSRKYISAGKFQN